jgi:hypothetical protein
MDPDLDPGGPKTCGSGGSGSGFGSGSATLMQRELRIRETFSISTMPDDFKGKLFLKIDRNFFFLGRMSKNYLKLLSKMERN